MKICGIVAEYNPFHNGHAYHCAKTRDQIGDETAIVAVMSGNFVQRGDFAIVDKYRRAAMAVCAGVDLVIELPLPAALSSAEGFARGAVASLAAMGCVTHLSFGSECGDLARIRRAAACDRSAIREHLASGQSYAAALQSAVEAIDPDAGALLSSPNNTLGIEYCAAIDALGCDIQPITVQRDGAAHDSEQLHVRPSASALRRLILDGKVDACREGMPSKAFTRLTQAIDSGAAPAHVGVCDAAMLSYLRRLSPDDLLRFTGGKDGLQNRLFDAIRDHTNIPDICAAAQTRRYPLARIRRALLRAYLDLPLDTSVEPRYLRVLAIGPRGREVLRQMGKTAQLPVIIKPVNEKRLPDTADLRRDALADDLYALAQPNYAFWTGGSHFRQSPYVANKENRSV